MEIQAVAPLAPTMTAPVRNRMRACARSRSRVACGRRMRRAGSIERGLWTREDGRLIGSCQRLRSEADGRITDPDIER